MLARVPVSTRGLHQQARVALQILLVVAAVAAIGWVLYRSASLVLALILAAAFAYVIAPLVRLVEHPVRLGGRLRRLSRGVAIAVVYVVMAGSAAAGAALLLPSATEQLDDMMSRAPAYTQSILAWERGWTGYYDRLRLPPALRRNIDQSVTAAGAAAIESGRSALLA